MRAQLQPTRAAAVGAVRFGVGADGFWGELREVGALLLPLVAGMAAPCGSAEV